MTVKWDRPPEELQQAITDFGELVETEVGLVVLDQKNESQEWMKDNRPWRDQSSNARRGLRVEVEVNGVVYTMYFVHTVEYGIHLEISHGGRFPIIRPGVRHAIPRLKSKLRGLVD